jgi:hypothetical protein
MMLDTNAGTRDDIAAPVAPRAHISPITPSQILASAAWSWSLLSESESSVTVSLTIRRDRTNGCREGSYLLTAEVEILRDTWTMWSATEPLASDLTSTDDDIRMDAETAIGELEDDVACALDAKVSSMRMRGARNRDLPLMADAKAAA